VQRPRRRRATTRARRSSSHNVAELPPPAGGAGEHDVLTVQSRGLYHGHGVSDGKARRRSVSAIERSLPVSETCARRPTATGPRATRPTAFGYGPEWTGSRHGLVSLHGLVRRRPAKGPTGLARDSCPTTEPSVDRPGRQRATWPSVRSHGRPLPGEAVLQRWRLLRQQRRVTPRHLSYFYRRQECRQKEGGKRAPRPPLRCARQPPGRERSSIFPSPRWVGGEDAL
jgi:hypothetical protein